MSYIGTEPKDIRSFGRTKFDYTATQGQTAFTGADDDGKVLAFTVGQIEVYVNGILMDDSDFTTTGTGTVTLATAANLNDVINVVSFETNIPDSNYVPATGGTFTGAVTAANGLTVDDDGATPLTVDRATSDGTIIDLQKDGTSVGTIGAVSSRPFFSNNNTCGIRLANNTLVPTNENGSNEDNATDLGASDVRWKDLYLSGGAYIGGTGAANKLEDYETGTFSGQLYSTSSGSGGVAYTAAENGYYVKVGALVHFQIHMNEAPSGGSATNGIHLVGLPFVSQSYAPINMWYYAGFSNLTTYYHPMPRTNSGLPSVVLQASDGNGSMEIQKQHFGGSLNIMFSGTYYTTA